MTLMSDCRAFSDLRVSERLDVSYRNQRFENLAAPTIVSSRTLNDFDML